VFKFHHGSILVSRDLEFYKKLVEGFKFHHGSILVAIKEIVTQEMLSFKFHHGSILVRVYLPIQ